jgi:DNA polymerase I-like protein with 3'-5' exonuclease and polymerase domains
MYAKNEKIVSSYLRSLSDVRRVYPQINFHTQAGGRHSITKPALATLPPDLRDIIMPDTGQVWIGWDWDAQEPRIQWGESGSRVLESAFNAGYDIHTMFVCDLYGWEYPQDLRDPHHSAIDTGWRKAHNWGGKDDPRRIFSKTTRYELNYDHSEKAYNAQQKAIRMGISPAIAKVAAQKLLNSDPELRTWFKKIEDEGYKTRIARSWGGGRRVIYWADSLVKFPYNDVRNFPLQGGGADLYNITLVEMSEEVPEAHFVWGAHDSQWYSVDAASWESVYPRIRTVAERPRLIGGRMIPFPGSFKMVNDKGEVTKL